MLRKFHFWIQGNQGVIQVYSTCFASVLLGVMSIIVSVSALNISKNQAEIAKKTLELEIAKNEPQIYSRVLLEDDLFHRFSISLDSQSSSAVLHGAVAATFYRVLNKNISCTWVYEENSKISPKFVDYSYFQKGTSSIVSIDRASRVVEIDIKRLSPEEENRIYIDIMNFAENLSLGYNGNFNFPRSDKLYSSRIIEVHYSDQFGKYNKKVFWIDDEGRLSGGGDGFSLEQFAKRKKGKIVRNDGLLSFSREDACERIWQ